MLNLYIIGCGGTGSELAYHLPKTLADLALALIASSAPTPEEGKRYVGKILRNACKTPVFSMVKTLTFIDADVFEPKNALRQMGIAGPKAVICANQVRDHILAKSWLQNVEIRAVTKYVKKSNIEDLIPLVPEDTSDGLEDLHSDYGGLVAYDKPWLKKNIPVIFMVVDKLSTRYVISKYVEQLPDAIVINGGNTLDAGHVTVYERRDGKALDPNLFEVYKDVTEDADVAPDEEVHHCTDADPERGQTPIINSMVALYMLQLFCNWVNNGLGEPGQRVNEVMLDPVHFKTRPMKHRPTNKA